MGGHPSHAWHSAQRSRTYYLVLLAHRLSSECKGGDESTNWVRRKRKETREQARACGAGSAQTKASEETLWSAGTSRWSIAPDTKATSSERGQTWARRSPTCCSMGDTEHNVRVQQGRQSHVRCRRNFRARYDITLCLSRRVEKFPAPMRERTTGRAARRCPKTRSCSSRESSVPPIDIITEPV